MSVFFGLLPPLPGQTIYTFYGDVQNIASGMIPRIYNHSYTISADLVIPEGGAEGVIVAEADHLGGFSLFVADGRLKHTYSMMGVQVYRQESDSPLPTGEVNVRLEFHADAAKPATGGDIRLFANGQEIGKGRMDHTVPFRFSAYAGMDIGRDNGGVVDRAYANRRRSRSPEPSKRSSSTSSRTYPRGRAGAARGRAPRTRGPRHQRIAPGAGNYGVPRLLLQRVRGNPVDCSTKATILRPQRRTL